MNSTLSVALRGACVGMQMTMAVYLSIDYLLNIPKDFMIDHSFSARFIYFLESMACFLIAVRLFLCYNGVNLMNR